MNLQMIEKRVEDVEGDLDVFDIWHTIQGEGPFAGRPAFFIRLAGCNLQCPQCDTDYTSKRKKMSYLDIGTKLYELKSQQPKTNLIVITGGEPFRQPLGPLCQFLLSCSYNIQVETNGTLYDESMAAWWPFVTIVCSPKTPINEKMAKVIHHYKYVLSAGHIDPLDGLPLSALGYGVKPARPGPDFRGNIYVQPCDESNEEWLGQPKNKANLQTAVESCLKFGYYLCLQTHKIAGLP